MPSVIESRSAVQRGSSPNAYTPYEAALSDEPWPTMRTVVAPRSRSAAPTRRYSASCSSRERRACGCSRISVSSCAPSGGNADLPRDQHAFEREVVVDDDDVRRQPRPEPADGVVAQNGG